MKKENNIQVYLSRGFVLSTLHYYINYYRQ